MQFAHIRTFSYHYRNKFGTPVGKIPIDLGVQCPNRLKGGCLYCSAAAFSPRYLHDKENIARQVRRAKNEFLGDRFRTYFIYFQQETPTVLDDDVLLPLIDDVLSDTDCVGLIISTRPDYLKDTFLDSLNRRIKKLGKDCLFELGLQSTNNSSLRYLNRNHSFEDFVTAVKRLRIYDSFEVGVHLLMGIPGETQEDMISSVQAVCTLGVDALKIHHLQVLRDTPLEKIYNAGGVEVFSKDDYLQLLLKILPIIPENIVIHRLWATAHPETLIAPKWNVLAAELSEVLRQMMDDLGLRQGCKSCSSH